MNSTSWYVSQSMARRITRPAKKRHLEQLPQNEPCTAPETVCKGQEQSEMLEQMCSDWGMAPDQKPKFMQLERDAVLFIGFAICGFLTAARLGYHWILMLAAAKQVYPY